jgi:cysteinyl-tRNA synthetase
MHAIYLFDTLTEKIEKIDPLEDGTVKMFVCGPTVQGPIHVGHARTYIFYDTLARVLLYLGFNVRFIMNITDIDEKIYEVSSKKGLTPEEYAEKQATEFIKNMKQLGIESISSFERVSSYIEKIIIYITALIEKGFAYREEGYVFFDTSKCNCFGSLSHLPRDEVILRPIELNEKKRNMLDFTLWKPSKVTSREINSPWGTGSPGWHIQDTAITLDLFPEGYDIHGGAYELVYPHHEAQMAITKAVTGKERFANHWVHTHLLNIERRKMSKSEGNVVTVNDMLRTFTPSQLRFALLSKHYRKDMDYEDIKKAVKVYDKIKDNLSPYDSDEVSDELVRAIVNDMDTERVIQIIQSISDLGSTEEKKGAVAFSKKVLGIDFA